MWYFLNEGSFLFLVEDGKKSTIVVNVEPEKDKGLVSVSIVVPTLIILFNTYFFYVQVPAHVHEFLAKYVTKDPYLYIILILSFCRLTTPYATSFRRRFFLYHHAVNIILS